MSGPRVTFVRLVDLGKSYMARMLLIWATRLNWMSTFMDLYIGKGSIFIPRCITTTPIEMPIDPIEGIPLEMPIVYFYGNTTPR